MMTIRKLFFGLGVAIFSLTLSLAALLLAVQANRTAQESIALTTQTSEFAKQSKVDIWGVTRNQMVTVNTCFDVKTNLYVITYQTQNSILVTNLGGNAVSLVGVGFSDGEHEYDVSREAELKSPIGLLGSVEIFPGSSRELFYSAAYHSAKDQEYLTKEHAQQVVANLKPTQRAFWQFHFSDGSVYRVELESLWFASGLVHPAAFDKCDTLEH
jgi:hypothetical protein